MRAGAAEAAGHTAAKAVLGAETRVLFRSCVYRLGNAYAHVPFIAR